MPETLKKADQGRFSAAISQVQKKVLPNGMTVLVRETHEVPKVSIQVWYHVGSKDEKTGEKGIAHLIEHMLFKGTEKDGKIIQSESDINTVTHMLSGNCNAFTSFDYTGYLFNFPTHHWKEALFFLSDCMQNAAFKEDHLSSEMKAVIQELKMRKDNYFLSLVSDLLSTIFADHPYHYPIIGFKQDLWTVNGNDLKSFYKKHYCPNNATLVVVGDVNTQEVFDLADQYFGAIEAKQGYKKEEFYLNPDIGSKSVTIYRDVNQPTAVVAFLIPGIEALKDPAIDVLSLVLGVGKGSRLYRKIVDELHLATSLTALSWGLFEHSLFIITFEPKSVADIPKIEELIIKEIDEILAKGLSKQELERAVKQSQMQYYSKLESNEKQAYDIGQYFLATGDENYSLTYLDATPQELEKEIKALIKDYFRPSVMHKGLILPLQPREREKWVELQKESDAQDQRILSARIRTAPIEDPVYAATIEVKKPGTFDFPKPLTFTLSNGLKVLYYNNRTTPKINMTLSLKARDYYDDPQLQGLYNFVTTMMMEGTEKYTAAQLADAIEQRGMNIDLSPGHASMSMLSADFTTGLDLFNQVLAHPRFDEKEIGKVREQLLVEIKNFWDNPRSFAGQLVREAIYKGHPFSKNTLGTVASISKITKKDLIEFYKKYITPQGATLAIVGDLDNYDVQEIVGKSLGSWHGPELSPIPFTSLAPIAAHDINHLINRDQVLLCFAGLSVDRKSNDYDKLSLFDQIFGGGSLGSMSSRLFQLREQSGLFYSISGSLTARASEQPGMTIVQTLVSLDRLAEAEKAIKNTIDTVSSTLTQEEFDQAKNAIVNTLVQNFESNSSIAGAFIFLDRYGFSPDYFDKRASLLEKVTIADVQEAVKKVLASNKMLTLRVGRVGDKTVA